MLSVNNLSGFGAGGSVPNPITTLTPLLADGIGGNNNTYTFTGHGIGTADPTRWIFVMVGTGGVDAGILTSVTCTIGGTSATKIMELSDGVDQHAAIFALLVPTGTTATIVVALSHTTGRIEIQPMAVYTERVGDIKIVENNSQETANGDSSYTIATDPIGAVIGLFTSQANNSVVWTGLTESIDSNTGGEADRFSTAYLQLTNQTSLPITVTSASTTCMTLLTSFKFV